MAILWNIINWGSILHGTVLSKFYQKYWTSGYYSTGSKTKHALKQLIFLLLVVVIVLAGLGALIYVFWGATGFNGIKAAILVLSNVYNMIFLVVLLAYGLFNLPVHLWKYADNKFQLYQHLEQAHDIRQQFRDSQVDFFTIVSQCKNLVAKYRTGANTAYMDLLMEEMPQQDLEGMNIVYSKNMQFDINEDQEINEEFIAKVRYDFKLAFFLYKRKKARWVSLFNKIEKLIEQPVVYDQEYMKKDIFKDEAKQDQENLDLQLVLKVLPNSPKKLKIYRVLSILGFLLCGIIIVTEGTIISQHEQYTLPYLVVEKHGKMTSVIVIFTVFFLSSLTLVCFFTIFNMKLSDYLQLVPKHTDCLTFQSITGMCCKIVTTLCFNYMTILGEVSIKQEQSEFKTSYNHFYSSMIKVPFFGQNYNTIMPFFILVFGIFFAIASLLKLRNKALATIKQLQKKYQNQGKETSKKDINTADMTLVQRIFIGERAIISEYDLQKKKEDRNRLLRYNQVDSIELVNQNDEGMNLENQKKKKSDKKMSKDKQINDLEENLISKSDIKNKKSSSKLDSKWGKAKKKKKKNDDSSESSDSSDSEGQDYKKIVKKREQNNQKNNPYAMFKKQRLDSDYSSDEEAKKKKNKGKLKNKDNKKNKYDNMSTSQNKVKNQKKLSDNSSSSDSEKSNQQLKAKQKKLSKMKRDESLDDMSKESYLLKKSSKKFLGIAKWQKRYVVLEGIHLTFYEDENKKIPKKQIGMKKIYNVVFHYDEDAPIKSKQLKKEDKNESRFDVYTKNRIYKLKTEDDNLWEAEAWVRALKESARHYNPDFED